MVYLYHKEQVINTKKEIKTMTKRENQKQTFEMIKKAIESGNYTNEKLAAMIYRFNQMGMITRKQATELTFMF
jgi:anti-sigma28 factor (negative regulator of flagellin synthesis)